MPKNCDKCCTKGLWQVDKSHPQLTGGDLFMLLPSLHTLSSTIAHLTTELGKPLHTFRKTLTYMLMLLLSPKGSYTHALRSPYVLNQDLRHYCTANFHPRGCALPERGRTMWNKQHKSPLGNPPSYDPLWSPPATTWKLSQAFCTPMHQDFFSISPQIPSCL